MSDYASQSGHFYHKDGTPAYTIVGKNGKERNTTLRDARVLNLVPSVTTVLQLAAKPGLDQWKTDQVIMACLTMPKVDGETEKEYIARLKEDAKAHAKAAADKGTWIHGCIEKGFRGDMFEADDGFKYFDSVFATIEKECGIQQWNTEKSFASELGFGGKVDLHNEVYLIDFKTTDKELASLKVWPEMEMQLASYDCGLENTGRKCGICYVHRDTAESKLLWLKEEALLKGQRCFLSLLEYYYCKTGLER